MEKKVGLHCFSTQFEGRTLRTIQNIEGIYGQYRIGRNLRTIYVKKEFADAFIVEVSDTCICWMLFADNLH